MIPNGKKPNNVTYNNVFDVVIANIKLAKNDIVNPISKLLRTPNRSFITPVVNPANVIAAPHKPYAEPASVSLVPNSVCKYITNICDKLK